MQKSQTSLFVLVLGASPWISYKIGLLIPRNVNQIYNLELLDNKLGKYFGIKY